MGALIAAYLAGWVAVSAYVSWLAVQNGRLARRLEELQGQLDEADHADSVRRKAA
jgi:CcmD family protein